MSSESLNFIEEIIADDLEAGRNTSIITRFPPEPNGYLHIGHAKSICLNFGLTQKYPGKTILRFDDTNPTAEKVEYVESIKEDVKWLGFDWEDREYYTSDYFDQLYDFALQLIRKGLAYVDDSDSEEIARQKGSVNEPGQDSVFRARTIDENLALFEAMKNGEFPDGSKVLRAKIDMSHPNMNMRDPVLYRVKHAHHHRTGDTWKIYPMYDFAHGQSDSIEGITHSICTLEFENHRPLYEWLIDKLEIFPSRQYEFARLNLSYTIMSKRKLLRLVEEGHVQGWDDPRLPTISGLRRRGFTPASIRLFCDKIGVAKRNNVIDYALLEFCVREDLNKVALRRMAVLDKIDVFITNYPEDKVEMLSVENNPEDPNAGSRELPFSHHLYIEKEDFRIEASRKYFRMKPGSYVRLKGAYILRCDGYTISDGGEVTQVFCTYFPDSKSGQDTSGIKAKGTLHWVSAPHAVAAKAMIYDRLFRVESPDGDKDVDFVDHINPHSLEEVNPIFVEPALANAKPRESYQFLRNGYFCLDSASTGDQLIFNRTVTLRDSWKGQ